MPTEQRLPQVLTPPEIAEHLRLPESTVREMLRDGILPGYKVGRAWRIDGAELQKWKDRARRRASRGGAA